MTVSIYQGIYMIGDYMLKNRKEVDYKDVLWFSLCSYFTQDLQLNKKTFFEN